MGSASQIRNTGQERYILPELLLSLRKTADAISAGIAVEEERTQLRDPSDPSYPILARSLRARLANLKITIEMLEAENQAA